MYRTIDATHIIATAERLHRRIDERFEKSGLGRVAAELETVAREAVPLSDSIARPNRRLRALVGGCIALLVFVLVSVALQVTRLESKNGTWSDFLQGLEALVNDVAFVGIATYFMLGLETRHKRRRVLRALHTLRSLVHIVDMHQLTKDPERIREQGHSTASSPERTMSTFELARYLDYSSEMLAIIGKIAALYVQDFEDPVALDAASSVQDLAVNHSRAIWQKLMILNSPDQG